MSELIRPEPRRNVYEEPFWEFVERHDLRLQRCSDCAAFRYPPSGMCHQCLSGASVWVPISGAGSVLSWVTFHRQYFPELPVPYVVVAVETPEGPILLANLIHADGVELSGGMPVRICYETARTAAGKPWQIYQWEPA